MQTISVDNQGIFQIRAHGGGNPEISVWACLQTKVRTKRSAELIHRRLVGLLSSEDVLDRAGKAKMAIPCPSGSDQGTHCVPWG